MEITKISSKGQVVIPQKIRDKLNIVEGSIIMVDIVNEMILLKKIDSELVNQFKDSLSDLKLGKIKKVA